MFVVIIDVSPNLAGLGDVWNACSCVEKAYVFIADIFAARINVILIQLNIPLYGLKATLAAVLIFSKQGKDMFLWVPANRNLHHVKFIGITPVHIDCANISNALLIKLYGILFLILFLHSFQRFD